MRPLNRPPAEGPGRKDRATDAQVRAIYLIARELGWTERAIQDRCQSRFGRPPEDLSKDEASRTIVLLRRTGVQRGARLPITGPPPPSARDQDFMRPPPPTVPGEVLRKEALERAAPDAPEDSRAKIGAALTAAGFTLRLTHDEIEVWERHDGAEVWTRWNWTKPGAAP